MCKVLALYCIICYNILMKLFHRSKWKEETDKGTVKWMYNTYVRPTPKPIKGKNNLSKAKREKVNAMKSAGHTRGDNSPFK